MRSAQLPDSVTYAVPFDARSALDPATEYYAFKVFVTRAKTTGVGACPGCDVPVCIALEEIPESVGGFGSNSSGDIFLAFSTASGRRNAR